jgi:hypothetical protein
MTEPKKKRGRPRKAASAQPQNIQITRKSVTGENKQKFVLDQRLVVGEDVSAEVAQLFLDKGLAVSLDGKTPEQSEADKAEAAARLDTVHQKQRADTVMARHDAMDAEERQRAQHIDPEEGEDV